MNNLKLKFVTQDGRCEEYPCDSIHLPMTDDKKGRGGGSMGIRKGFPDAVIALKEGTAEAFLEGSTVFFEKISGGFAIVKSGVVTLAADVTVS